MSEEPHNILAGASPLRFVTAAVTGNRYQHCKTLAEARATEDMVVIMEGDYGGHIYFTCPVTRIRCDAETLSRLLADLDALCWDDPDGAGLYFELVSPKTGVAGGMGGGMVLDGIWLHDKLQHLLVKVEAVVSGASLSINS